ncbi:MAG: hypothetical protein ACREHF_12200 [Rhizomicrobium sp.]
MILDLPYNFHWIEQDRAARAAQAYAGFLRAFLDAHGIRAIVNLRGRNPHHFWWRYETRTCEALGIVHRDAKLNSRQLPARAMLLDLIDAFDAVPRPLLVKCSGGQDRTSFAAALYLLHNHGWGSFAAASRQFARWPYFHWPRREQRWLGLFPEFSRERAQGSPLADWIAREYDARAFAAWLAMHGEAQSFSGLYGVKAES